MSYGTTNYEQITKVGFIASLAVFGLGAGGYLLAGAAHLSLPGWERTLLLDMEILGTLGMLLIPLVFGIVMPLAE